MKRRRSREEDDEEDAIRRRKARELRVVGPKGITQPPTRTAEATILSAG